MRPHPDDVEALVTRLAAAFSRKMTDSEKIAAVATWTDVLTGVPWPEVEQAADAYAKDGGRYMPSVGDIAARARDIANRRFGSAFAGAVVVWHADRWSEGRDPDSGRPALCHCGNREWFTRAQDGTWHGWVSHRANCAEKKRAAADQARKDQEARDKAEAIKSAVQESAA